MNHERDMRCVLNSLGECLAKVPMACLCRQMPETVFAEAHNRLLLCTLEQQKRWTAQDGLYNETMKDG